MNEVTYLVVLNKEVGEQLYKNKDQEPITPIQLILIVDVKKPIIHKSKENSFKDPQLNSSLSHL